MTVHTGATATDSPRPPSDTQALYQEGIVAGVLAAAVVADLVPHRRQPRRAAVLHAVRARDRAVRTRGGPGARDRLARHRGHVHLGPRARVRRPRRHRRPAPRRGRAQPQPRLRHRAVLRAPPVGLHHGDGVRGAGGLHRAGVDIDLRGQSARRRRRWSSTSASGIRTSPSGLKLGRLRPRPVAGCWPGAGPRAPSSRSGGWPRDRRRCRR